MQSGDEPDRFEQLFAGNLTILDLSHAISSDNPVWGANSESPFHYEVIAAHESGLPIMGSYQTAEHYGTHLDAPIHDRDGLATVDEIETRELFGPAVVLDIAEKGRNDPDYALSVDDIEAWEIVHGRIPAGAIVLLNTGWSRKWDDHKAYLNRDANGRLHFPGYSKDAAGFLVRERAIKGIGIDNMSVDPGASSGFPAHNAVNGSGRFHLENVANVHLLPPTGAYLIVAPIKIEKGSGGQVRLFAVIP